MKDMYRQLMLQPEEGERTFPEIAAILGQPETAVKTRYYRLMTRLRKEFG